MQLFYTPDITFPIYELPEEESRHCLRVLRMTTGDELHLTDGRGNLFRAQMDGTSGNRCRVRITETFPEFEKRPYKLTVAVAPTKNLERFEWFLEKAVETGIDRIIPIDCDHSERHILKSERQEKIITSALKQSLKAYRPVLDTMTPIRNVITSASGECGNSTPFGKKKSDFDGSLSSGEQGSPSSRDSLCSGEEESALPVCKLIAHCREDFPRRFIGDVLPRGGEVLILIGPEGDFSREEVELAYRSGFVGTSLGNARLRTETAALAAVTIAAFVNR